MNEEQLLPFIAVTRMANAPAHHFWGVRCPYWLGAGDEPKAVIFPLGSRHGHYVATLCAPRVTGPRYNASERHPESSQGVSSYTRLREQRNSINTIIDYIHLYKEIAVLI